MRRKVVMKRSEKNGGRKCLSSWLHRTGSEDWKGKGNSIKLITRERSICWH